MDNRSHHFNLTFENIRLLPIYCLIKQNILFPKSIFAGFCIIELPKLIIYFWFHCKLLPYFGEDNVVLHYLDTDSFVFFVTAVDGLIND